MARAVGNPDIRTCLPAASAEVCDSETNETEGNAEIYIMNADGSDQQRLTNTPAADLRPG